MYKERSRSEGRVYKYNVLMLCHCYYVGMPPSFYGMIHGITHSTSFEQAVRNGILAAGDNCSRNNFIGAYTAARYIHLPQHAGYIHTHILFSPSHRYGLDSIPVSWLDKYPHLDEAVGYIETIAKL